MAVTTTSARLALISALGAVGLAGPALAGSHSWRFGEVFSSDDGSIQFIELKECCGMPSEIFMTNKWVKSNATGNQFFFPGTLQGNTANKRLLLATVGFAALDGAPAPDFIIQDGFFDPSADTLDVFTYDSVTFGPGELPLDGVSSLVCQSAGPAMCTTTVVAINSPTNFAGESGSVVVPGPCVGDLNGDDRVNVDDLVALILDWGPGESPADFNEDGTVDVDDLVALILAWGVC